MKSLPILISLLSLAGTCVAGTITKGSVSHRVVTKDTDALSGGRTSTVDHVLMTTLEGKLTPDEVAALTSDVTLQAGFPLGPSGAFKFSEDPNFEDGDTSVKITRKITFKDVEWKTTITMRWTGGNLRMTVKVSAKEELTGPSPIKWEDPLADKDQATLNTVTLLTLVADNGGTEVLKLGATVKTKTKTLHSIKTTATGDTKLLSNQSVRGSKLLPL